MSSICCSSRLRTSSNHDPEQGPTSTIPMWCSELALWEEKRNREDCFVSSEKCWLIQWQFLGRFWTHFQPDTQLSKVLNVNFSVLYPFTSPYSLTYLAGYVNYWAILLWYKTCLFFGNNPFISLPFLFSLSCMLLKPKIFKLTSLIFKRLAYSWSG